MVSGLNNVDEKGQSEKKAFLITHDESCQSQRFLIFGIITLPYMYE